MNGFGNAVASLALVQKNAFIAVGYLDGLFRVVDLEGRAVIRPQRAHSKAIRRILWEKDRELILTFGEDGAIRVWRLEVELESDAEGRKWRRSPGKAMRRFSTTRSRRARR